MGLTIARVDVFGYDLTYVHGSYMMSGGRVIDVLPSTVVRVTTTDGVEGFGEVCPLGPAYLPSHGGGRPRGARASSRPPSSGSTRATSPPSTRRWTGR